ncbi:MAG: thiamine-phosphate kinase [Candidatus Dormibacteraeota bacterium]|nr:thiamine-phosphate kinase [Candidatus Dormibacteraeota bacterium]MBV9524688.1 thiamine-phosphate kinase [Candidatus Dormibacteraeota bacterium]
MSTSVPLTAVAGWAAGGATLAETGEADVLRRLVAAARERSAPGLELPAGDDAAVWRPAPGLEVALSQDAIVEGKDFLRDWTTPRQLGRKAVVVALSDLAGMGAEPAWCTASLCAPGSTRLGDVVEIQAGMLDALEAAGCALAGGDVSDIDGPLVIAVGIGGTLEPGQALRRDRGRPGDALLVTGALGRAAAGLRLLRDSPGEARLLSAAEQAWIEAQVAPEARVSEGQALVRLGAEAGGDISDGLLADATWLAEASGCSAELWVDSLPVDADLREAFGGAWAELALGGGEDFELLAAVRPEHLAALLAAWPAQLAPLTVVGRLGDGAGLTVLEREGGAPLPAPPVSSRHYG